MHTDNLRLREYITQHIPVGWNSVVDLLYQCYDCQGEKICPKIPEYHRLIQEYTEKLPFADQNLICTAVNSLCVEYERFAFRDGVLIGAKLMMELSDP